MFWGFHSQTQSQFLYQQYFSYEKPQTKTIIDWIQWKIRRNTKIFSPKSQICI